MITAPLLDPWQDEHDFDSFQSYTRISECLGHKIEETHIRKGYGQYRVKLKPFTGMADAPWGQEAEASADSNFSTEIHIEVSYGSMTRTAREAEEHAALILRASQIATQWQKGDFS